MNKDQEDELLMHVAAGTDLASERFAAERMLGRLAAMFGYCLV